MKKIKAFTLIELIVVMIITSFIITGGYYACSAAMARFHLYETKTTGNTDLSQLSFLLRKDFSKSVSASLTTRRKLTLKLDDPKEIVYYLDKDMIARKTEQRIDTFWIEVNEINSTELEFDRVYITELSLDINAGGTNILLSFEKNYDPFFYMNHNN